MNKENIKEEIRKTELLVTELRLKTNVITKEEFISIVGKLTRQMDKLKNATNTEQ